MSTVPSQITALFQPFDQLIAWVGDDMLHLKRLTTSPLDSVEMAPLGDPLSLDEIDDIVHEVRYQRREVVHNDNAPTRSSHQAI